MEWVWEPAEFCVQVRGGHGFNLVRGSCKCQLFFKGVHLYFLFLALTPFYFKLPFNCLYILNLLTILSCFYLEIFNYLLYAGRKPVVGSIISRIFCSSGNVDGNWVCLFFLTCLTLPVCHTNRFHCSDQGASKKWMESYSGQPLCKRTGDGENTKSKVGTRSSSCAIQGYCEKLV